jgi:DNA-binding CsgD family transcriptional regulator
MRAYFKKSGSASSRAEWLGLICTLSWFFCVMYNYYEPLFAGTATVFVFMMLLCVGLLSFALLLGKRAAMMNRVVILSTTAGAVCTALVPFQSATAAVVLFWFCALFMTPLLCRRLYGVLMIARDSWRIRSYISAVSVTIVIQMIWALLPLPYTVKFPIAASFALLGLYGASAHLPEFRKQELPKPVQFVNLTGIAKIIAVLVLLVALNLFSAIIHTHVLYDSLNNNNLFSLMSWAAVPFGFYFFAWLGDKSREQLGFSLAMAMLLLGCIVSLMPEGSVFTAPIVLLGEFGGTITEYCFLTMPLLFFSFTKRPILVAVSGLVMHTLLASMVSWTQDLWLPPYLLEEQISRSLIIFGAVCILILIPLIFSVWKRQEDTALTAALLGLKKTDREEQAILETPQIAPSAAIWDWETQLDLLADEHRIATLLCDGMSRSEISEATGLSVTQVAVHLRNIRTKLERRSPLGLSPEIRQFSEQYGLTGRETEVLNELMLGRSNAEIGANLHIEETTVKTHVGRVLKKVGARNRSELISVLRG